MLLSSAHALRSTSLAATQQRRSARPLPWPRRSSFVTTMAIVNSRPSRSAVLAAQGGCLSPRTSASAFSSFLSLHSHQNSSKRATIKAAASSTNNTSANVVSMSSTSSSSAARAAAQTVTSFYTAWNAADADGAVRNMSDDVEYWDTIYERPFVGRENVRAYFAKAARVLGPAVVFVVDGLAPAEDGSAVGVKWHCELDDGTPLPNSRGCSFYELEKAGTVIVKARDFVEPAVKPGAATLYILRAVLPLVRLAAKFDSKDKEGDGNGGGSSGSVDSKDTTTSSSSEKRSTQTLYSTLVWSFYLAYFSFVFFSRELPGLPVLETPPEVLTEVVHESWTFFYFVPIFNAFASALSFVPEWLRIPDFPEHPTSEALFNFVNAWSMMMLPVMLSEAEEALPESGRIGGGDGDDDKKSTSSSSAFKWWLGVQFLTNVFMIPYMALRARESGPGNDLVPRSWNDSERERQDAPSFPSWTPVVGAAGAAVGAASILWALYARPDVVAASDLWESGVDSFEARWAWASHALSSNRATWAFALDAGLYSVWQAAMLRDARPLERFVPFFGMAAFLMRGGGGQKEDNQGRDLS